MLGKWQVMQHRQIVIVGGGPIGLTLGLFLAKNGISVSILDEGNNNHNDGRVLALSYASIHMLKEINAWPEHLATPIKEVHISHSGLGVSNILSTDVDLPCLGYTIKYSDIRHKLLEEAKKYTEISLHNCSVNKVIPGKNFATIEYKNNSEFSCCTADLAILAEGGKIKFANLAYKDYDYVKSAITAEITASMAHNNIAYERFDNDGASVLLPHGDNFVLVWSLPKHEADDIIQNNNLIDRLSRLPFMKRFGKIQLAGKVYSFPLKLQVAKSRVLDRIVLIGNSAQTLHPISAQGMNLALRDAATLSELIISQALNSGNISNYDKLRKKDAGIVINFTHALARFLEYDNKVINHLRGTGIITLSNFKPLQNMIAGSLIFGN
jgi:2-octaprenyl-6-methoxyphenol hydroxylase